MLLVSISGLADDLSELGGGIRLIDSRATVDDDGQWTVVGYVDDDTLSQLNNANMAVTVIDDEESVASDFAAALADIEPDK